MFDFILSLFFFKKEPVIVKPAPNVTSVEIGLPFDMLPVPDEPIPEREKLSPVQKLQGTYIGNISSTGHSTGPHLHIQEQNGYELTAKIVAEYFSFDGKKADEYWVTNTEAQHKARGSRGLDLGYYEGTVIRALDPSYVSEYAYDSRSGYNLYVEFENGAKFILAHLASPDWYEAPKEPTEEKPQPKPEPVEEKDVGLSFEL